MSRLLLRCLLLCCLALVAGCPKSASKGTALEELQYAYSAAVRWATSSVPGTWSTPRCARRIRSPTPTKFAPASKRRWI